MEGTCTSENCERPAEWRVAASTVCCWKPADYCRECARALWYQSGMFGRRCQTHSTMSQITYHPIKIEGSGECKICGKGCEIWKAEA